MLIGVPLETYPGERRVALVPALVPSLHKAGLEVIVERGAGEKAGFGDSEYEQQGARLASDREELLSRAELVVRLHGFQENHDADLEKLRSGQLVVGLLNPLGAPQAARLMAGKGVTAFALELLPRITRAQPMDALTSMATVAGYKAVLLAGAALSKMYPMMITAAGTVTPARVLVLGAGVAGLQAIASSRRLGAVVRAYDIRPAVKEQVQSLGAKFLELQLETSDAEAAGGYARAMGEDFYRRQSELLGQAVAASDVVITTAAVPGKKAPLLVTKDAVGAMRPGSVVVDLAAESGGNCELTRPGETVTVHGVTILGPVNLASTVPCHASQMYARNVVSFLTNLFKKGQLSLNLEDPIIRDTLLTHEGEIVNARLRELLGLPPVSSTEERSSS